MNKKPLATDLNSKRGRYDLNKYLNDDIRDNYKYTLLKNFNGLLAGTEVALNELLIRGHLMYGHVTFDIPTSLLAKPPIGRVGKDAIKFENMVINNLSKQLQKLGVIDLLIGNKTYSVKGVKKSENSGSKCDFYFYDEYNIPIFYISHKKGVIPGIDFQHYGGISNIINHPIISDFNTKLLNYVDPVIAFPDKIKYIMDIDSFKYPEIIRIAMFGEHYDKDYGLNNVHAIMYGIPSIITTKTGKYKLTAPKIVFNDDKFIAENCKLQLMARKSTDRNNIGFQGCRILIVPEWKKISKTIVL